jgi:hypothetical protein
MKGAVMDWAYGMRWRNERFIPERSVSLRRYKFRCQNSIKMYLKKIEWDTVA